MWASFGPLRATIAIQYKLRSRGIFLGGNVLYAHRMDIVLRRYFKARPPLILEE